MKIKSNLLLYSCLSVFFQLSLMAANSQTPILRWEKMANGVWKAKVGKPETNNLLSISESKPKTSAINEMSSVAFPLSPNEIKFEIFDLWRFNRDDATPGGVPVDMISPGLRSICVFKQLIKS